MDGSGQYRYWRLEQIIQRGFPCSDLVVVCSTILGITSRSLVCRTLDLNIYSHCCE